MNDIKTSAAAASGRFDQVSGRDVALDPRDRQLHIENVKMVYHGSDGPKTVLDNVDLRIAEGSFVALVGPSGCGKSTLLRLLLGSEEPTSGLVCLDGEPVGFPDLTRGIVTQDYSLFPNRTVLSNIMMGFELSMTRSEFKARRSELTDRAVLSLKTAHLDDQMHKYPSELSGGQRQRAAVLQALILDPKVLLMDEPFGALDPGVRVRMQTFLLEQHERTGKTIVFVTHDLEEAVYLSDRVVVLSQHYTDGRGDVQRGSRIVCDLDVGKRGEATSTKSKEDPAFTETIERVRRFVTKPDHLWHIGQFDLKHPDSFHTLGDGEKTN